MGHLYTIKDQTMIIQPVKSRVEVIQNIPPAKNVKECENFYGVF